jgi:hypothetical protein
MDQATVGHAVFHVKPRVPGSADVSRETHQRKRRAPDRVGQLYTRCTQQAYDACQSLPACRINAASAPRTPSAPPREPQLRQHHVHPTAGQPTRAAQSLSERARSLDDARTSQVAHPRPHLADSWPAPIHSPTRRPFTQQTPPAAQPRAEPSVAQMFCVIQPVVDLQTAARHRYSESRCLDGPFPIFSGSAALGALRPPSLQGHSTTRNPPRLPTAPPYLPPLLLR